MPSAPDSRSRFEASDLRIALLFAALMLAVPLGAKLAQRFGWPVAPTLGDRAHMALIGAFIAWMGNTIPKRLTPLDRLRRDPARAQAFFRLAGWTWVITGLALGAAWLALPLPTAGTVTLAVVPAAMLFVLWRWIAFTHTPHRAA